MDLLELYAAGMSSQDILADYPDLEPEDLRAALDDAARALDHPVLAALARWIQEQPSDIQAVAVRDIGLRDASDPEIFAEARAAGAVVPLHRSSGCGLATAARGGCPVGCHHHCD
jgi:hypothetical protein